MLGLLVTHFGVTIFAYGVDEQNVKGLLDSESDDVQRVKINEKFCALYSPHSSKCIACPATEFEAKERLYRMLSRATGPLSESIIDFLNHPFIILRERMNSKRLKSLTAEDSKLMSVIYHEPCFWFMFNKKSWDWMYRNYCMEQSMVIRSLYSRIGTPFIITY